MAKEVELIEVKCQYCKEMYECIKDLVDLRACPDCIDIYYHLKVDGSYEKRDKPREKNDLSYRQELQPVTHRGKYKNL